MVQRLHAFGLCLAVLLLFPAFVPTAQAQEALLRMQLHLRGQIDRMG